MDGKILLRVLGSLELKCSSGRTCTEVLAQPKRVALLTYLALARPPGWRRRDTLQGILWPERDREHAQSGLRKGLYILRQELGEAAIVRRGDQEVRLAEDLVWCDAVAFERGAMGGELEGCTELYRGNLLEGFFIREAPEFERWLDAERARLAELYEHVVSSLADGAETELRWLDQVRWRRRLTRLDPYNSRYVFRLMEALLQAGEPANAIRAAAEHRRFVQQDLGAEPAAEVVELAERLRESMPQNAAALDVELALEGSNGRPRSVLLGNSNGEAMGDTRKRD
jgi:DNA-binding SARP family transcriptional activator